MALINARGNPGSSIRITDRAIGGAGLKTRAPNIRVPVIVGDASFRFNLVKLRYDRLSFYRLGMTGIVSVAELVVVRWCRLCPPAKLSWPFWITTPVIA